MHLCMLCADGINANITVTPLIHNEVNAYRQFSFLSLVTVNRTVFCSTFVSK